MWKRTKLRLVNPSRRSVTRRILGAVSRVGRRRLIAVVLVFALSAVWSQTSYAESRECWQEYIEAVMAARERADACRAEDWRYSPASYFYWLAILATMGPGAAESGMDLCEIYYHFETESYWFQYIACSAYPLKG